MKNLILVLSLGILLNVSSLAVADWQMPVTYMEGAFGCKVLNPKDDNSAAVPDFSVQPTVNIGAGQHGEVRLSGLGQSTLSLVGDEIILKTVEGVTFDLGTLVKNKQLCYRGGTGENLEEGWNAITVNPKVQMSLSGSDVNQYSLHLIDLTSGWQYQLSW